MANRDGKGRSGLHSPSQSWSFFDEIWGNANVDMKPYYATSNNYRKPNFHSFQKPNLSEDVFLLTAAQISMLYTCRWWIIF
jgi:hypothetical protein